MATLIRRVVDAIVIGHARLGREAANREARVGNRVETNVVQSTNKMLLIRPHSKLAYRILLRVDELRPLAVSRLRSIAAVGRVGTHATVPAGDHETALWHMGWQPKCE